MRTATATAPAGPPIAPSSQAIRLRNRAGNSWGDLTRESEKQHCVPMVQAALYQLALERKVGEYALPEGASLIACGKLRGS